MFLARKLMDTTNKKATLHFDMKMPKIPCFEQEHTCAQQTKSNFIFQPEKALKVMFWTRKGMHTPNKKQFYISA